MATCAHCGNELTPGARFCGSCGQPQPDATATRPTPPVDPGYGTPPPPAAPGYPPAPPDPGYAAPPPGYGAPPGGYAPPPGYGVPAAPPRPPIQVAPSEIVVLASAVLFLISSFLDFYSASAGAFSKGWSAWSNSLSMMPILMFCTLAAVALGALAAVRAFAPASLGSLGRLPLRTIELLTTLTIALTVIGYVVRPFSGVEGLNPAVGAYLMLVAAGGLVTGAFLRRQPGTEGRSSPLSPGVPLAGIIASAGGGLTLIGSFIHVVGRGNDAFNGWTPKFGMFALTLPVFACAVVLTFHWLHQTAKLPQGLLGIPTRTWALGTAAYALLLVFSQLIGEAGFSDFSSSSADKQAGFWMMFIGTLLVGGGVIAAPYLHLQPAATAAPGGYPPGPGGYAPQPGPYAGGYAPQPDLNAGGYAPPPPPPPPPPPAPPQ